MATKTGINGVFAVFDAALEKLERVATGRADESRKIRELASEAATIQRDQKKLNKELDQIRNKAAELVTTSKQAATKIDTAMGHIRSVLHTNN